MIGKTKGLKLQISSSISVKKRSSALNDNNVSKSNKFKLKEDDFQFICELGTGAGGTVHKVLHTPTNRIMAKKVIGFILGGDENEREKSEKGILRELKVLRSCESQYIVEFYGAFSNIGDISICMEYIDLGSFDKILKKLGTIPEDIVAKITVSVLKGLKYLYDEKNIVHRDIKPSNILLNSKGEVKIADFGVSKEIVNGTMARTFTGTQGYLAPERVCEGRIHSIESDIWSVGLTMMELATGRFPFPPEGHAPLPSILDLLKYIEMEPAPSLPTGKFSKNFENFVSRCLIKDPDQRPKPKDLLNDSFCIRVENESLAQWADDIKCTFEK